MREGGGKGQELNTECLSITAGDSGCVEHHLRNDFQQELRSMHEKGMVKEEGFNGQIQLGTG